MSKIIGIDLGTTNSCVAVMKVENLPLSQTRKAQEQHLLSWLLPRQEKDWLVSRQNVRQLPMQKRPFLLSRDTWVRITRKRLKENSILRSRSPQ